MNLKSYLRSLPIPQREPFAHRCGCTLQHLKFVAYGAKAPSEVLALAIERETGGAVTLEDLKPAFKAALESSGYRKCDCAPPTEQSSHESAN